MNDSTSVFRKDDIFCLSLYVVTSAEKTKMTLPESLSAKYCMYLSRENELKMLEDTPFIKL